MCLGTLFYSDATLRIKLTCAILFIAAQIAAQPETSLRFERVKGLSQSTAYSITKDKQGFIWVATPNGLNRYDGVQMKVYKPGLLRKKGQMEGRIIRSKLLEDDDEQIWFSTEVTLHCFNKKTGEFTVYPMIPSAGQGEIGVFANPVLKRNSGLWLSNASEGIFHLDTDTKKSTHYPLMLKDESGSFIQIMYHGVYDGQEKLWFASNKGLVSFDISNRQWQRHLPNKPFYSVALGNDTLYASEGANIVWVDIRRLDSGYMKFGVQDDGIRGIIHTVHADSELNIWVGDERGNVFSKSSATADFRWKGNINYSGAARTNYPIYTFFADSSGILWTGSFMLGLLKAELRQPGFNVFPRASYGGTNDNLFVSTVYEDDSGKVWMGTFQKGLAAFDTQSGRLSFFELPYEGPQLTYGKSIPLIKGDSWGNLWLSMSGHLFLRAKGTDQFSSIKIPPPSNALQVPQLWSLSEYGDGWLLGTNIGLYHLTRHGNGYSVTHLSKFKQKRVYDTWVRENGEIWVAFESGGVNIVSDLDESSQTKTLFSEANVKSFQYDESHRLLWISTSNGLVAYHLPTGAYKSFTEENGLLNSNVYGTLSVADQLWISTTSGLSQAILTFSGDEIFPEAHFTNFTSGDGLPENEFNAGAFHKGKSGRLYFGTTDGVVWFKPGEIQHKVEKPQLRMLDVLVNEEPADSMVAPEYLRELSLPYFKNNLFFRFRGIDYKNSEKVNYTYKMEGWDEQWINSRQLNEVRYNNLPHGNYTFRVRAANSISASHAANYAIGIVILPPFWKTTWFYLLSGLFGGLIVFLVAFSIIRWRIARARELMERKLAVQNERERISRDMHDELGAGLTQISIWSELLRNSSDGVEEDTKNLSKISSTSRELITNLNEIIWALKLNSYDADRFMAYVREYVADFFENSDISCVVEASSAELPELSQMTMRNIFLIVKEACHNIKKHSRATKADIRLIYAQRILQVSITDDGIGMTADRNDGNGLKNMSRRANDIGGDLQVYSDLSMGTCISLQLLIKIA